MKLTKSVRYVTKRRILRSDLTSRRSEFEDVKKVEEEIAVKELLSGIADKIGESATIKITTDYYSESDWVEIRKIADVWDYHIF